tara:strand:+ start:59 stop:184 length:126 start_codon:yes stop_codon:yes gene_type:complete
MISVKFSADEIMPLIAAGLVPDGAGSAGGGVCWFIIVFSLN